MRFTKAVIPFQIPIPLAAVLLIFSPPFLMAENQILLSKDKYEEFRRNAASFYSLAGKINGELQLSTSDQRLLMHLPKRGFPELTWLLYNPGVETAAESKLFAPDYRLKTESNEEGIAEELFSRALELRLAANNYTCFQILKTLAPTPEAMKFEVRAKNLSSQILSDFSVSPDHQTEEQFLKDIEGIRALFDQLKDLPKLTPGQLAEEREENAALTPDEYFQELTPKELEAPWVDHELKWLKKWDHDGFLIAYSECTPAHDNQWLKMVVNMKGGIFECHQTYALSGFGPDSYESKLTESDFDAVKDFLAHLPSSKPATKNSHYVISFLKNDRWTTRTYDSGGSYERF